MITFYVILFVSILLVIAGMSDAIVDITKHKFEQSLFFNKDHLFWNPDISWKNKYEDYDMLGLVRKRMNIFKLFSIIKPVQMTDAFHFFKMLHIVCLTIACYTLGLYSGWLLWSFAINNDFDLIAASITTVGILFLGVMRNVSFSFFYKLFKIK